MYKNQKGVTLTALVVIIILLIIIAAISATYGTQTIKKAEMESVKTDMLMIQAKAKEYVEQANFKKGQGQENTQEVLECLKGTNYSDEIPVQLDKENGLPYSCTQEEFTQMGLKDVDANKYIIIYYIDDATVDVICKYDENRNIYYTLSSM